MYDNEIISVAQKLNLILKLEPFKECKIEDVAKEPWTYITVYLQRIRTYPDNIVNAFNDLLDNGYNHYVCVGYDYAAFRAGLLSKQDYDNIAFTLNHMFRNSEEQKHLVDAYKALSA